MHSDAVRSDFAFFPGCLARLKLPQIECSVRFVLEALGIGLHDQPGYTCCPDPVVFRSASRTEWITLAARNLSLDRDRPILTLCPGCASSLSEASHLIRSDEKTSQEVARRLKRVGSDLNLPEVSHFLRILSDGKIQGVLGKKLSKRLDGLRVACHYGCHLVRPSDAVGFDDPEKPTSMDTIIALTGAESVDYEDKYLCCGRPSMDESTSLAIAEHKLGSMQAAGCDLIVVACPFCFEQFDLGQAVLAARRGVRYQLPVVYITQLLGIAMGRGHREMGFHLHRIKLKGVDEVEGATY